MSNENNEEIELFDYMDEESESRKIPVNKKEKTGGKSGRSKKKKKAGALTWVGRVAATIGITLALIIVWLYGVMAVLVYGPSKTAKNQFVLSVQETSAIEPARPWAAMW